MDYKIICLDTKPPRPTLKIELVIRAYFDNGCQKKLEARGCAISGQDWALLISKAQYYGKSAATNNIAEAIAMWDCEQVIMQLDWFWGWDRVQFSQDSHLMVSFMNRKAKLRKQELVYIIKEAQECLLELPWRKYHFRHAGCKLNKISNWLCRVAISIYMSSSCTAALLELYDTNPALLQ